MDSSRKKRETMALHKAPTLSEEAEKSAILIAASDATSTGKPRAVLLSDIRNIQERVNPLIIKAERTLLASYDLNNLARTNGANALKIKQGSTRHNFETDGFWLFEFHFMKNNTLFKTKVSAPTWNASRSDSRIIIAYRAGGIRQPTQVWREHATAFRLGLEHAGDSSLSQNAANGHLKAIYGERLILERRNPNG